MKRCLCVLFALLIALCAPSLAETQENLVVNGDFSQTDELGMPVGWMREMWHTDVGVSQLYVEPEGYEGNCIVVLNADANDARFAQTIEVEPDSVYRFSCMVKVDGCGDSGYGATLSFEDTFSYSDSLLDTDGQWRSLTVYGRTGENQSEVTLFARVGGYGMENTGRAYFDNIEVVKVDAAPEGETVLSLAPVSTSSNQETQAQVSTEAPKRNTEAYLLLAVLYGVLILAIARRNQRLNNGRISGETLLIVGLSAALIVRIGMSGLIRGYYTDINCFSAWSERMFANGPTGFYAEDYFCDYPPGYMLLLWLPAAVRNLLGISLESPVYLALLKLIPVACDLLGALLVWRVARKFKLSEKLAAVLALIYAFNPAVIIDSAAWGQIDSVFTLLLVLCAVKASEERYPSALVAFAAAMLIKPQAMLFAPLGLVAIGINLVRAREVRRVRNFALGMVCALGMIYCMAFLFYIGHARSVTDAIIGPVTWIVELYGNTLGSYAYITINAMNLYTLLNLNWVATASVPAWTIFAWCMFSLSYLYTFYLYYKTKQKHHLALAGAVLIALIFTFGPMIHERYIYPALLLLAVAFAMDRDRRLLLCLTVMTITTALNELMVLQGGMTELNYGHLQSSEQWLNALLSLINVLNTLYLCYVALDICVLEHCCELKGTATQDKLFDLPQSRDHRLHLKRWDYLLMAVVTVLYSVLAFTNLGTMDAPQTAWVASRSGENVIFDLGSVHSFRMTYYGGICDSTFTVELSNDGENWTQPYYAQYSQGEMFRWLWYVPRNADQTNVMDQTYDPGDGSAYVTFASNEEPYPYQTAQYVRITAQSAGLNLLEFGFWSPEGELLGVSIAGRSGELADYATDPENLIDEQDCVVPIPSYCNGTYFDEIYHARTAYEMEHGLSVYEWTHPPLGKVVMMLGIKLFGMTPFGWRFMGALVGVLMVPLMYLLAKQLTKSTKLSFAAMCLMALDSMHFTQTRIATIDSYAVFWIMLMYLFMFRYFQMDWNQVKLGRTLVPLGLCGVTMGVAIATKWIGIYAAVGLAVLFFWKVIGELCRAGTQFKSFFRRTLWTGLFCLGFFIVIPVLIYYFSYTPQLRYEGVVNIWDMLDKSRLERVIELQKSMLGYHAGLGGDTHYFRSPWYQWPVIWWPMWYFSGTAYLPNGNMISSISCMGNPAVWWTGLGALIFVLLRSAWQRKANRTYLAVLVGFASQFLPWVLVPRSTFIYHYFASVPFIILCTVLMLGWLRKKDQRIFNWAVGILLALALILFVAFYPLESGLPVSREYAQYLRWFKWYNF